MPLFNACCKLWKIDESEILTPSLTPFFSRLSIHPRKNPGRKINITSLLSMLRRFWKMYNSKRSFNRSDVRIWRDLVMVFSSSRIIDPLLNAMRWWTSSEVRTYSYWPTTFQYNYGPQWWPAPRLSWPILIRILRLEPVCAEWLLNRCLLTSTFSSTG